MTEYEMLARQITSYENNLVKLRDLHKAEAIKFFIELDKQVRAVALTQTWFECNRLTATANYTVQIHNEYGDIIMEYLVDAHSVESLKKFKAHILESLIPMFQIRHRQIYLQKKLGEKANIESMKKIKI